MEAKAPTPIARDGRQLCVVGLRQHGLGRRAYTECLNRLRRVHGCIHA